MRLFVLLWLLMAGCLEAKPFQWPWNSRAKEQARLNAATAPKPTSREEEIMKPDLTKEFNPSAANFGSGRAITGQKAATNEFHFVNRTQTKSFATKELSGKQASGMTSQYETKTALTKESWFARLTAPSKSYATRESSDAGKGLQARELPTANKKFVARGRRQAELDKNAASAPAMGGDRDFGQSWSGDVRPLTIQDVKTLLNKN